MSDWEDAPAQPGIIKIKESNIKQFAGIGADGYPMDKFVPEFTNEAQIQNQLAMLKGGGSYEPPSGRSTATSTASDAGWEDGSWEDAPKDNKTSYLDDVKLGFAQVGNLADRGLTLAASNILPDGKKQEWFDAMEERAKSRNAFADIGNKEQSFGGKLVSAASTLPMQVMAAPLSAIDTAVNFIKNGESLENAYKAAGVDAALTAVGFVIPAGFGKGLVQKALTGGGANAAQEALSKYILSHHIAETEASKQQFAPSWEDAGVAGVLGVGFGAAHSRGEKAVLDPASKLEALAKAVPEPTIKPESPAVDTVAHADDFAATNPYDVGGHVSASEQGHPTTIDNPQGDLFGGEMLERPAESTPIESLRQDSLLNDQHRGNAVDYGLSLVEKGKEADLPGQRDLNFDTVDTGLKVEKTPEELARTETERMAQEVRDADYTKMEAERQLQIAREAGDLEYQREVKSGNKTMMDNETTARMVDNLRQGDLGGAIKQIADNHQFVGYRDLANYLSDKLSGINVRMHLDRMIDAGDRAIYGYFDNKSNTVGFSVKGAVSPHTILHETVHALTAQFMHLKPNSVLSMGIRNVLSKVSKDPRFKDFPSVTNEHEFIAEAFSNHEFQDFLKGVRINDGGPVRNAFTRFVNGVKSILGVKTPQLANALDHTIDLGKEIMEHSTEQFRKDAAEALKREGMPKYLMQFMAEDKGGPKKLTETIQNEAAMRVINKLPGAEHAVSDFAFYNKTPEEIVQLAKGAEDIPNTVLEKASHALQAGGLFESLKTKNPVVKYTYERVTRAFQDAAKQVREKLTDEKTGLKQFMRDMTPDAKGEIHSMMMMDEGQRVRTAQELAAAGFSDKQIAYYNQYRQISKEFFDQLNARRTEMGLKPMDERTAHIAGRFMGDFSKMVYEYRTNPETGAITKHVVGRISGATKWKGGELDKATQFIKEKHPEWEIGEPEYNGIGKGKSAADRFSGLMEALNFVAGMDTPTAKLLDSYRDYIKSDAVNYLNATRHAKAKVEKAGGIVGSEGNKPWKDTVKNAEEGMKAQLSYFEQGYQWVAMEKAVGDISKVVGDESVTKQMPNAVDWANKYLDNALGRKQGWLADATAGLLNTIGETSGLGHGSLLKFNNRVKHLTMQKFMGLMNIPFTVTQLMQPFQTNPALIRLLRNRGLEFSTSKAAVDSTQTMLNIMLHDTTGGMAKLTGFEKEAAHYASDKGVFDVKMTDHTRDINSSPIMEGFDKLADYNIQKSELLTRGTTFLFYSHVLKDAGIPLKDVFGAAENMTNMAMVNYHPAERPMMYSKMGWLGDVASTLTRYKHNQLSQIAFYTREGVQGAKNGSIKASAPLATFLGTALAFGGVMGFYGFQAADAAYSSLSENVFKKPDNLTNLVLKSGMPETISHGMFAALGLDMTSRFSNANTLPDSVGGALMPYGSALVDMASNTYGLVKNHDATSAKRAVKAFAPSSAAGLVENNLFTEGDMYINSNTLEGRVKRSPSEQSLRAFGFRNLRESKELAQNYADSQINKGEKELQGRVLEEAKRNIVDGTLTPETAQQLSKEYARLGNANLAGDLAKFMQNRKMTQFQQQQVRNANGGFGGAQNLKQQMERFKK